MSTVHWKEGLTLAQDADAVKDYTWDFTKELNGETLSGVVITGTNCTAAQNGVLGATSVKVRVSAVTASASVRVRYTTNTGQIDDRTVNFTPSDY